MKPDSETTKLNLGSSNDSYFVYLTFISSYKQLFGLIIKLFSYRNQVITYHNQVV